MRLVHLFNSSSVSGPEKLVLPALARSGHSVVIVNLKETRIGLLRESDPLEAYARSLNLDYFPVTVSKRWDPDAVRHLAARLSSINPDLVHAHDVKASVYLLHTKPLGRYPILSTHHGIAGRPDWKTKLYESFYRYSVLKFFDRVLCVSSADHEHLLKSGLHQQKLRLHLNGIDGVWMDPSRRPQEAQRLREAWFPQDDNRNASFYMGVVGRLSAEKDPMRLLRVLSAMNACSVSQDWRCLMFGTGPLERPLRESARRMGLQERVVWMGYRPEAAKEMAGLDVLLSFSKAEGLPINLLEAGWAGTPVMATRVGGVTDLVPDEKYGTWIAPEESPGISASRLLYAMTETGLQILHGQAVRFQKRITTQFTGEKWMARLMEIYAELNRRPVAHAH